MTTQLGKDYKCIKDFRQGNCSYTKGKTYHCSRNGFLDDDSGISWSFSEKCFNEQLEEIN